MKVLKTVILFIFISTSCLGQNKPRNLFTVNDSLKLELKKPHNDSVKAYIALRISENFLSINPDSAIVYCGKSIKFAEKGNQLHLKTGALGFLSTALLAKGNLPKSMEFGLSAIELNKKVPKDYAWEWISPAYFSIGDIYLQIEDLDKAEKNYKAAMHYDSGIITSSWGYFSLAKVYEKANKLDAALNMLDKSQTTFNKVNRSTYPNIYDLNVGMLELRAKIYLKQNKPDLALKEFIGALKTATDNGLFFHTSNINNDIAEFYQGRHQRDSALYYAETGLEVAKRVSNTQGILKASGILAALYDSDNPAKALYYYKLNTEIRNQLYGAGNIQIMGDMIAQNEKKQNEIAAQKVKYQNRIRLNIIMGVTFILLLIAIFMYVNSRRKQRAKQIIEKAYDKLKSTQAQLIQSEKMASLGELTAGIAHEIQNPLNFVNNFSDVSNELIAEMNEELDKGDIEEAKSIANDIRQNLEKINHHGKRADAIVKGMLQHSRSSSGQKEPTDINVLADEYLRLAYHGLRAKDKGFNAELVTNFNENLPKVNVIPQDIGRVLLNLLTNGFYATQKRKASDESFKPIVEVSTSVVGNTIEISVKDNGNGIPSEIVGKIFQPFFTTKPTGEGTGLGLSLAYDIVKAHGGELKVTTKEGEGTEFIIQLPKN